MTIISRLRPGRGTTRAMAGIAFAAVCIPAWASLGQPQASVESDAQALQGTVSSSLRTALTVITISQPNGTTVNEYIASSGTVVAVSWRGPRPPDLTQVLGSYYADYQSMTAARQPGGSRRHLRLDNGTMVFESGGHMRDLRGLAYLPAQLPQGVSAGDLH